MAELGIEPSPQDPRLCPSQEHYTVSQGRATASKEKLKADSLGFPSPLWNVSVEKQALTSILPRPPLTITQDAEGRQGTAVPRGSALLAKCLQSAEPLDTEQLEQGWRDAGGTTLASHGGGDLRLSAVLKSPHWLGSHSQEWPGPAPGWRQQTPLPALEAVPMETGRWGRRTDAWRPLEGWPCA